MTLEGKDVWLSVARKTLSSLIGAICGAALSYLLLWMNKDLLTLGLFALGCLIFLLITFLVYILKGPKKRALSSQFCPYLLRDIFKSLFNTLLFATAVFKVTLCIYASKSTASTPFYEALPKAIQDQINFDQPSHQLLGTLLITFSLYLLFNLVLNFINTDSEKKAKELNV
ncbi:hypothetical protein [Pseudomonas saxonica]|uniref:Uncharacterized protein n=1 Tax=Pseudomonas saxonica TaxID=2600598 RepID=A0ABY3GMS8_9PSED|nr:hypothetical protein [Pseudomonas saxonica]TWR91237.1 hypothetical protein FJD38_09240 [Pseudomonas saxonica]WRQ76769.1 hypothetical protein VQY67_09280 [Pseudomonas saxonica]